jgi:NAD(P)-dependent dehydrogenase (short-subunit alcohol dehydrogenase family)
MLVRVAPQKLVEVALQGVDPGVELRAGHERLPARAGRGIGQELCIGLLREGASVAAIDVIDLQETAEKAKGTPGKFFAFQGDVTDYASISSAIDRAVGALGSLQILINNAAIYGGMERKPFDQLSEEGWDRMMQVNVKGIWNASRAAVPFMTRENYGKIVNISSVTLYEQLQVTRYPPGESSRIARRLISL